MAQGDLSACSATQCLGVCSLGDASEQIKYWQASRSSLLTEGRVSRTMQPGYPANSSCREAGSQDCRAVPHHLQSPPAWGEASGHYFPHFRVFMARRKATGLSQNVKLSQIHPQFHLSLCFWGEEWRSLTPLFGNTGQQWPGNTDIPSAWEQDICNRQIHQRHKNSLPALYG